MTSPFHPGEIEAQRRAGAGSQGQGIRDFMPEQHRLFYASLRYVVVAGVDARGPIPSVLAGPPGFVTAPDATTLSIGALPDETDPARPALVPGAPAGLLGVELATRRRNRANGVVSALGPDGMTLAVQQAFGNCPQYIQIREVRAAAPPAGPRAEELAALDLAALALVGRADTFFIASAARTAERNGGVDVSHRGGRPGFVRVDGDLLTVPDFRGNRYFNTLGNLVANPRAGLAFVDFEDGTLLQLQGATEIVWDGPEVRSFPGAERLWRVRLERAVRRPGAVPLRWTFREAAPTTLDTGNWPAPHPSR